MRNKKNESFLIEMKRKVFPLFQLLKFEKLKTKWRIDVVFCLIQLYKEMNELVIRK